MKALLPYVLLTAAGALVVVLAACSTALPAGAPGRAANTATRPATPPAIPALDARAPAGTATATFALG